MNKQKSKKGIVLIYVLFLVTLSVVFSTILLNNNAYLFNISQYFDVGSKLYSNINSDAKILVDINREINSNGNGFTDNVSCPSSNVIMSGALNRDVIGTTLVNSGLIYCEGIYGSYPLKLYFNTGFTDLINAEYDGYMVGLTSSGVGDGPFWDGDNTLIDFSGFDYHVSDGFDDDFNSDNYMVTSTGNTSTGTYYLDSFQDDDVLGRKILFGYTVVDFGFKKVFWNTSKVLKIIDENSNNNDIYNMKLGDVTSGILHFDIDKSSEIKLVEFNKNTYDETNELITLGTYNGTLGAGIGYLQNNLNTLSLSSTKTGNEFDFDFSNKNYAIFLKDTGTGTLLYKISGETASGTGIYLVPIDDSNDKVVRYLGNEILINNNGRYSSKETELIYEK